MKIPEYLYLSSGRFCIVFRENRNLLDIQNGGPKFAKFAYLSEIPQFCSDLKKNCNQHDHLIPKLYIFVCLIFFHF